MKRTVWMLIVLMSAIAASAQTTQKVYLVEVTQPTQEKTQQVVTVEMYQGLQAEMAATNHVLPKAIELAEKEWKDKHADAGPFPRQAASPGQVKSLGMFSDTEKAEQALQDLQSREGQQTNKLSSAEKQVAQYQKQLNNLTSLSNRTVAQQTQINSLQNNIKMLDDQIARQKKKEDERNANLAAARDLVRSNLKQLLAAEQKKEEPPPDAQTSTNGLTSTNGQASTGGQVSTNSAGTK